MMSRTKIIENYHLSRNGASYSEMSDDDGDLDGLDGDKNKSMDIYEEKLSYAKKRKLSEDERLNRSRERNRIHARNTRERKKLQLDSLQLRVHQLNNEVSYLF